VAGDGTAKVFDSDFESRAFFIWAISINSGRMFGFSSNLCHGIHQDPIAGYAREESIMTSKEVFTLIKEKGVKFVDLRFTDTRGKEQHVSVPISSFGDDKFTAGHYFDGSSIAGWKGIQASDMILLPDPSSCFIDPFLEHTTMAIPATSSNPRMAKVTTRSALYCKARRRVSEVDWPGRCRLLRPRTRVLHLDAVQWEIGMSGARYQIFSEEAAWASGSDFVDGNKGHRPSVKGGYFPVPPIDSLQNIRSEIVNHLESMGVVVEVHHHEVATAGQNEIGTKFAPLVQRGDWMMRLKYAVHNTRRKARQDGDVHAEARRW
jgi:glutamine synthetase